MNHIMARKVWVIQSDYDLDLDLNSQHDTSQHDMARRIFDESLMVIASQSLGFFVTF